jgi:hypothetical protein
VLDFAVEVYVAHSVMARKTLSNKDYRTMQLDIDRVMYLLSSLTSPSLTSSSFFSPFHGVMDFAVEVYVAHSVMARQILSKNYRAMQLDIDGVVISYSFLSFLTPHSTFPPPCSSFSYHFVEEHCRVLGG